MKKFPRIAALAIAAPIIAACDMPGHYLDPNSGTVQSVQIHAEWELDRGNTWDIAPPMRLDIIMFPDEMELYWDADGNEISVDKRCDAMGGELLWYSRTSQFICEGIDY